MSLKVTNIIKIEMVFVTFSDGFFATNTQGFGEAPLPWALMFVAVGDQRRDIQNLQLVKTYGAECT